MRGLRKSGSDFWVTQEAVLGTKVPARKGQDLWLARMV
jgi:hypothetical protein